MKFVEPHSSPGHENTKKLVSKGFKKSRYKKNALNPKKCRMLLEVTANSGLSRNTAKYGNVQNYLVIFVNALGN